VAQPTDRAAVGSEAPGLPPSPAAPPEAVGPPAAAASPRFREPDRTDLAPGSSILSEISRRQVELSLMELDLKKAELVQKLAEVRGQTFPVEIFDGIPAGAPPAFVRPGGGTGSQAVRGGPGPLPDPDVRLIRKDGGVLVADLALSSALRVTVRPGDRLPDGLHIADIQPDYVLVRRDGGHAYPLGLDGGVSAAAGFSGGL
jgi:type IV pilus biogenesis protein PilP